MSLLVDIAELPDADVWEACPLCSRGHMVRAMVDFTFRQKTDRGRVTCRLRLPVSTCSDCGFEIVGKEAEALMDQAVRREYDKLPPASGEKR